jgi:hypothetical protein
LKAARESRDRYTEDLNAFLNGGVVRGVSLSAVTDPSQLELLQAIKARWERVTGNLDRLVGGEPGIAAVAKGSEAVSESVKGLAELSQQAGQQMLQAGGVGAGHRAGVATRDARPKDCQERRHVDVGG